MYLVLFLESFPIESYICSHLSIKGVCYPVFRRRRFLRNLICELTEPEFLGKGDFQVGLLRKRSIVAIINNIFLQGWIGLLRILNCTFRFSFPFLKVAYYFWGFATLEIFSLFFPLLTQLTKVGKHHCLQDRWRNF